MAVVCLLLALFPLCILQILIPICVSFSVSVSASVSVSFACRLACWKCCCVIVLKFASKIGSNSRPTACQPDSRLPAPDSRLPALNKPRLLPTETLSQKQFCIWVNPRFALLSNSDWSIVCTRFYELSSAAHLLSILLISTDRWANCLLAGSRPRCHYHCHCHCCCCWRYSLIIHGPAAVGGSTLSWKRVESDKYRALYEWHNRVTRVLRN